MFFFLGCFWDVFVVVSLCDLINVQRHFMLFQIWVYMILGSVNNNKYPQTFICRFVLFVVCCVKEKE